jgi:hypothetical protein
MTRFAAVGLMALASVLGAAAPGQAQDKRPKVLEEIFECREVVDPTQRLACFEAAADKIEAAESQGDVVVVDREQAQEARRRAFGLPLPNIILFGKRDTSPEMKQLDASVTRAWRSPRGYWWVQLDNTSVWRQIDTHQIPREPKAGSKVRIRSAALGSFFMKVDGQQAVRVHRVR